MSQPVDHDMTAVLEAIDHYSDSDADKLKKSWWNCRRVVPTSTNG